MNLESQAFCEAFWRGQSRRFALALHEGFIHFWEPESLEFQSEPSEWVWVVRGSIRAGQNGLVNPRFLEAAFLPALRQGDLGRLISLSKFHNVFLGAGGSGEICAPSPQREGTPFRFESEDDVFARPASHWLTEIKAWDGDENSDFYFARRWHDLSDNHKARRIVCLSRGDWGEMEQIGRLILKLEYQAGWESDDEYGLCAWIVQRGDLFSWRLDSEDADVSYDYPANLEELWKMWFGFFSPSLNYNFLEQHIATQQEPPVYLPFHLSQPPVEPSAHEQLETRLQLRDWLRERVGLSPEQIAELLS